MSRKEQIQQSFCTHEDANNDDDDEICDDDDDVATVESSVLMKLIVGFEIVVRRAFVAHVCLFIGNKKGESFIEIK